MMTTLEEKKKIYIQSVNNLSNHIQSDFLDVIEEKTKEEDQFFCSVVNAIL